MAGDADLKKLKERLNKLLELDTQLEMDYREKRDAVREEIKAILSGSPGIGALLRRLQTHFDQAWCLRYAPGEKNRYVWDFKKDVPNWKRLIQKIGVEELERRVLTYLMSEEPFYIQARHPFALFLTNVNRFTSEKDANAFALSAPVSADCEREGKHHPPCKDDQEHTRRKMADYRSLPA